jgi:hypothetical protein
LDFSSFILSIKGGLIIPFSVTIAEMFSAGVISKAGLYTSIPSGATLTLLTSVISLSSLISISI